MSWFELTLGYVLVMTLAAVVNKKSLSVTGVDELIFGSSVQLVTGVFCLGLAVITGWEYQINTENIWQIMGMLATYFVAVSLYYWGLKRIDLSSETILSSTGAMWGLVFGVTLLGEGFAVSKLVGVGLVILAVGVLCWKKSGFQIHKPELLILVSAVFYSLGAIWDKYLNVFGNPLSYISLSFGLLGMLMLGVYVVKTGSTAMKTFRSKEYWKGVLVNGGFYSVAFWSLFEAYNRGGEVSRMFPITLSVTVLVSVLGIWVLKERQNIRVKLVAMGIMVCGVWILGV